MKTSIFDMTFTLPPLVEMTQVKKDLSQFELSLGGCSQNFAPCMGSVWAPFLLGDQYENIHL